MFWFAKIIEIYFSVLALLFVLEKKLFISIQFIHLLKVYLGNLKLINQVFLVYPKNFEKMSTSMSTLPKPRLFRESSGSLRRDHSSSWSFPRAERFASTSEFIDIPLVQLPSTLDTRFTTLGKGSRYCQVLNDNPSPGLYEVPGQFNPLQRKPGVVFGPIPFKNPKKYHEFPGPGEYYVNKSLIAQNKGVKIKSKKVIRPIFLDNPAPNQYNVNDKLITRNRYSEIGMGTGKRHDFFNRSKSYIATLDFPGPGTYNIPSRFDKFSTPILKSKLNLNQGNKISESFIL